MQHAATEQPHPTDDLKMTSRSDITVIFVGIGVAPSVVREGHKLADTTTSPIGFDAVMKFHVLAVDYDGTLADNGFVDATTVDALVRLRQSGRRVVLVTGRLLKPLLDAFPEVALCDLVVAENGALLYNPDTRQERPLVEAPPREFVEKLAERGVEVDEVGRVIVATHMPYESLVLETIRDLGLELQIVFNKGAVMVLPTGVNKASGLRAALKELGLSQHNTVGLGDAENDEAFLKLCEARWPLQMR